MLQPVRRRTWAPRGQTPVLYAWDRHDRISAISAITVSPRRRKLGMYFHLQEENVRAEHLVRFVRDLHRQLGTPLILVWDRSGPHRKAARLLQQRSPRWLRIEWLPAYAPDLNPTEQCWNHSKYSDMANYIPADTKHLGRAIKKSFSKQRKNDSLLHSYFQTAKLRL
jgi:transposase